MNIVQIVFWICLFLLVYTYIIYPFLLQILSANNEQIAPKLSTYPNVYILIAAHNEESVIIEKLNSINNNDYPAENIEIHLGSDNSTDNTNRLIQDYIAESRYTIEFLTMPQRSGKIGTLNYLVEQIQIKNELSDNDVFISTDANVMFDKFTIYNLVRHFTDPKIGIVDSHIFNSLKDTFEVSQSESKYLNREIKLKHREGIVFGKLMGAFGGCFAIRAMCFSPIPVNLKVDDFFLCMKTMIKGYKAISDPEAICYEKTAATFQEEFKRKRRISSGNFQNMAIFRRFLLPVNTLGFVFFSHKVIRYIGPILMIIILLANIYLVVTSQPFMLIFLIIQALWYIVLPVFDKMCQLIGINILALRHVRYFNYMNLALLLGFKDYINGIDSNIWEPTKRI